MYAESAWRYVARMVNAVTGRSFSTTVWAETGVTSVIQGDASIWRRNRVYAWMSTVRPLTLNTVGGLTNTSAAVESLVSAAGCDGVGAAAGAAKLMSTSQV
jgi:hypothetical protein